MRIISIFKRFLRTKISKRERYLFYGVIAIIACFCLERFVFHNIFSRLTLLNQKIIELESKNQKAEILVRNKERIGEQALVYKDYLEPSSSFQKNPLSSILSHIESLARKNAGMLIDIKPAQEIKKTSTHSIYTLEIGFEGNLSQVIDFLISLQKSDILIEVERASLTPKEKKIQLNVKLSVVVFGQGKCQRFYERK